MAFIRNVDKLIEGLENKFFTEARARAAVAPDIAVEQQRAQAAESAEQSARQAADTQLQSDINAEQSARQSADSALSGRLDVVEGSGEGSVLKAKNDAKAYADQKIADLVNGAPGALDTLKEIADQLANDESAVGALTNTVASNLNEAKSYTDSKVAQEVSDRQAAVSSEQSARQSAISAEQMARESADQALDGRLDVLEQDPTTKTYVDGKVTMLQGETAQEVSSLEGMISAEESARQLADSNLSGRISVLEQDPTTKAYVDGEVLDLQGQLSQEISDRQSAVSSEQSRAQGAEQALDGRLDVLEQDPTTKTYVDGKVSMLEGEISQEASDRTAAIGSEQSRAQAAEGVLSGRIGVLEQDPTTKTYVDGKVSMLEGEVSSEESRAMSAEQALDGRLDVLEQDPTTKTYVDGEVMDLQGQISQEISDRQSAVSGEASARQLADNALDARLDVLEQDPTTKSYVDAQINQEVSDRQSAVSSEQSRAQAAEEALGGRLDVLESDPVTRDYVDFQDNAIIGQINTEKGRIDAILSASEADKDSFAEIVSLINSVDAANDSAFAGYVLSNNAALAQEISDRQADVNAEEQRALAAEGLLDGRLDVLESDPTTKTYVDGEVSDLQGQITQEIGDRQSAVSAEAAARSAEDLTMFKKDGSRQLTGSIIPNQDATLNLGSGSNKFYQVHAQEAEFTSGIYVGQGNFWGNVTLYDNTGLNWGTDGAGDIGQLNNYRPNNVYVKSGINLNSLTASKVMVSDASKNLVSSSISSTELSYLSGLSSNIQTQVNNEISARQSADTTLQNNINSEASARSAEDLTMFKKDGSRQLAGNLLFSAETFDIGAAAVNRPNNIYVKNSIVNAGSESIGTTLTMAGASGANMRWTTDGAGDIGASGANRPNNVYVKNTLVATSISTPTMNTAVTFSGGGTFVNRLIVASGISLKYSQKSTNYTITSTDYLVAVSDLSVSRVMTLPAANSVTAGSTFVIKDQTGAASQTNYIQIAPAAGNTIDGQSDYKIVMPYESVMLVSNGSNWFII